MHDAISVGMLIRGGDDFLTDLRGSQRPHSSRLSPRQLEFLVAGVDAPALW